MAGSLGVGGAIAGGLESGFNLGLRSDAAAEARKQRDFENQRQTAADAERRDQIARKNANEDDDRALAAAGTALDDSRYQLGALHAKYPDGNIPDTEARPLYEAVGNAHTARQAIVAKRYQPIIDATQQKWRDFASRAATGQADPASLSGQDLRDFIQATTGHRLEDFANGTVGQGVNNTTTGLATKNPGLSLQGANALLGPQIKQGLGGTAPDGSQIIDKNLYALLPAPGPQGAAPAPAQNPVQGLAAALGAATGAPSPDSPAPAGAMPAQLPAQPAAGGVPPTPDDQSAPAALGPGLDPNKVMPVLQVTTRQPDGRITTYHAPVTKDRSASQDAEIAGPLDATDLMDRMGRLGVVDNWLKTPEMAAKVQDAIKNGAPTTFEQAWGMVHGDPKALAAQDPTSQKIAAIRKLQKDEGYANFEDAARAFDGRTTQAKGVQATLDAIDDDDTLTDAQKAEAHRIAVGIQAKPKAGKGTGVAGSGATSPALGGAAAPDPKSAAQNQVVDFWAKAVIAGDKDWQVGLSRSKSGSALIEAVKKRVPAMATELGLQPQDIGTARAQSAALSSTLKDLTKRSEAVDLFASKVQKDMATFNSLLDNASTGSPLLISKPINALRRQFSDSDLAQLDLAAKQVGAEYERLITGGTLSVAQLHAGASEDARKLINGDMPPAQARAVMKIMTVEMENARSAAHESTARVQNQLRGLGNGPLGGVPPPSAPPPRGTGLGAAPAPAGAAAPKKIANDADYNALPSGATYIAPDGTTRTKR